MSGSPPPLHTGSVRHEAVRVEGCVAAKHEVAGASDSSREDAECFALAVLGTETGEVLLAAWVLAEEEDGSLTEGPFEMGVADLGAGGA